MSNFTFIINTTLNLCLVFLSTVSFAKPQVMQAQCDAMCEAKQKGITCFVGAEQNDRQWCIQEKISFECSFKDLIPFVENGGYTLTGFKDTALNILGQEFCAISAEKNITPDGGNIGVERNTKCVKNSAGNVKICRQVGQKVGGSLVFDEEEMNAVLFEDGFIPDQNFQGYKNGNYWIKRAIKP